MFLLSRPWEVSAQRRGLDAWLVRHMSSLPALLSFFPFLKRMVLLTPVHLTFLEGFFVNRYWQDWDYWFPDNRFCFWCWALLPAPRLRLSSTMTGGNKMSSLFKADSPDFDEDAALNFLATVLRLSRKWCTKNEPRIRCAEGCHGRR